MSERQKSSIELEGAGAKLKLFGIDPRVITDIMIVATLVFIGAMSADHRAELQSLRVSDGAGRAEMIAAIRELASSQRYLACILATPEDQRKEEYTRANGMCAQMARAK